MPAAVAALDGGPRLGHALGADAEQAQQVGVGAEAPVAHPDAELRAQAGGHQRVVHALDGEGRHRQRVGSRSGVGPSTRTPSMARRPSWSRVESAASCSVDGVPADARQLVHGGAEGDGSDHVGRSGLFPIGRVGPDDLVEIDQVDGAAPGQEGVAGGEDAAAARSSAPAP